MKSWYRADHRTELGKTLLSWRQKATNKFFSKIITWLLGAFVFGMLTAILLASIGAIELAQNAARIVFFIIFICGLINAYLRNMVHGLEYRITEKALVHFRPFFGFEKMDPVNVRSLPFLRSRIEYMPWQEIKEIKDENETLLIIL